MPALGECVRRFRKFRRKTILRCRIWKFEKGELRMSKQIATNGGKRMLVAGLIAVTTLAWPALAQRVILVDDDGAQCPGAVRTIQEAVATASAGATIVVCQGT